MMVYQRRRQPASGFYGERGRVLEEEWAMELGNAQQAQRFFNLTR